MVHHLAVGPGRPLIEELRDAAERHHGGRARIVCAWAREDGVSLLLDALRKRIETVEVVLGMNGQGTSVEALLRLIPAVRSLRVFYKHPRQTFHPKFYWFDDGQQPPSATTLIVGSSNLTSGGLVTNFEASLVMQLHAGSVAEHDHKVLSDLKAVWDELTTSCFAHLVTDVEDVQNLYEAGYLATERTIRQRHDRVPCGRRGFLPVAPPRRRITQQSDRISIPFPLQPDDLDEFHISDAASQPQGPSPVDLFYVRSLTKTDVAKLHGAAGTFEPNIGRVARDQFPGFWGWPDKYVFTGERKEWRTRGKLFSSLTGPQGVDITITLWYREPRPDHAEEHRIGLGPISTVRSVTPDDFDTTSLMVVEGLEEDGEQRFLIRLVTATDPEYGDYSSYLTEIRPHHRFGYGP